MTTERDPGTRTVLSWLREDAHENAESVLLRALDEVDTTPQRGRVLPARRFFDMNTFAKVAIGAAAVVVVAVGAVQFFPVGIGPAGQPTSTPLPTASPAPDPSPAPLTEGPLAAGRYALNWSGPPTSVEVPAGWTGTPMTVVKEKELADVGWGGSDPVTRVFDGACQTPSSLVPVDGTLQGLVDALDAQVGTDATVTDVTLGGHPAKRVELVPSPGIGDVVCRTGDKGLLQIWEGPNESDIWALYPGARGLVHALDIDGNLVIFNGVIGPEASPSDLAELEAVIASTRIGP
jgi:hypothetical protein